MGREDKKRLDPRIFKIDPRVKEGYYTDEYFNRTKVILETLAREKRQINGVDIGNIEVTMQIFQKNDGAVVCGTDEAIAILKTSSGEFVEGSFVNRWDQLTVRSLYDGDIVHNDGAQVQPWETVMQIEGPYRYFAHLETVYLGALARRTKIASNVYKAVKAADGTMVLFFPARFDLYQVSTGDGYAYQIGCKAAGAKFPYGVSTDAQGSWWGARGMGTIPHALIASAGMGDTVQAALLFAEIMPSEIKRIVLVDFDNDCVGTSLKVARAMKNKYQTLLKEGNKEEAKKYKLFAVRLDTAGNLRDTSVSPRGKDSFGVCPELIEATRRALDAEGFEEVLVGVSGGFNPEKIRLCQQLGVKVGFYGVGSWFFSGNYDYTADIVRIKVNGEWRDCAKVGRKYKPNPRMEEVRHG
jgi:nicotinate phosphoribosyltransferase